MRVLCIASRLLGNRTFAVALADAIGGVPGVSLDQAFFDADDYGKFTVAGWQQWSDPVHVAAIARQKFSGYDPSAYDTLVISAWDLLPAVHTLARALPTTLALDVTPMAAARVHRQLGATIARRVRRYAGGKLNDVRFRRAIEAVDTFAPMSEWCAESLRADYGIPDDRIVVTWNPIDLTLWRPGVRRDHIVPNILFVGNDLERKGFAKLIDMVTDHELLRGATLTVVSSDPALQSWSAPPGVTLVGALDCDRLLAQYQASDLMVLPTTTDYSPNVLAEASAVGLPAVASDVGGIRDLVKDGVTGRLLPVTSTAGEWVNVVRTLLEDTPMRRQMGHNARLFAEQRFDARNFRTRIQAILRRSDKLLANASSSARPEISHE